MPQEVKLLSDQECAKMCAETKNCAGWTLGHGMKWCYAKTKATCKVIKIQDNVRTCTTRKPRTRSQQGRARDLKLWTGYIFDNVLLEPGRLPYVHVLPPRPSKRHRVGCWPKFNFPFYSYMVLIWSLDSDLALGL